MPKVAELTQHTIKQTSARFEGLKPLISVILPTYSRGDNGLFESCLKSILAQSFEDFELIIVDDGSVDATASIIEKYMQTNSRICWLRHPKNIGLPALSCNEAYLYARADKIFFAFDDNELEKNAFEVLFDFHKNNEEVKVCYACTKVLTPNGNVEMLGADDFDMKKLWFGNNIPNGTVLVDREVFETVGLYDVHISMTRLCDWDFWLRVGRKFFIHRIDAVLSTEKGPVQADSLWYTHHRDYALILEWMASNRNNPLKPDNINDYDVSYLPKELTFLSKTKIVNLLEKKFPWLKEEDKKFDLSMPKNGYALVLGEYDENLLAEKVILINQADHYLKNAIDLYLNASVVIFTYKNAETENISAFLKEMNVAYYYYEDIANERSSRAFSPQDDVFMELLDKHKPQGVLEYIQRTNYMCLYKSNLHIIKSNFKNLAFVAKKTIKYYWSKLFKL